MLAAVIAAAALAPARFPPRPGWHAGAGSVHACIGVSPKRCRTASSWAATVPLRDCINCLPHRTLDTLPADGIVIQVSVSFERPRRSPTEPHWPIRIERALIASPFEGLPARVGVFQQIARAGLFDVSVFVFFGRPRPTARQLALAESELRAARVP
jgi:hypothetical protein